ncbi:MAG: galactokinase [Oscillospiraceae bacterium]|nr:galactokinase [Oscillospiraceae bacterium]
MSEQTYRPDSARVSALRQTFIDTYGAQPTLWCSAPGRTELGGNHTDHQGGHVLAASVNMDMLACAAPNGTDVIRVLSQGHPAFSVKLGDGHREREATSGALVQGMAELLRQKGFAVSGCDISMDSHVPAGSGLSSSAAFEVLMGQVLNCLFCDESVTAVELAMMAQQAENQWFGKPCGLMDQAACAVGGAVAMDLGVTPPQVEKVTLDAASLGYALCIINVGADHADLTDAYAAIPAEMGAVAAFFGKTRLRDVAEGDFWANLTAVRRRCGDRAAARAAHFFREDRRAHEMAQAMKQGDFDRFLSLVRESGRSSGMYLQNSYAFPQEQSVTLALAAAEQLLDGRGAVRVHGGGFAGTIQAWVPTDMVDEFRATMEQRIGPCYVLEIRNQGVIRVAL